MNATTLTITAGAMPKALQEAIKAQLPAINQLLPEDISIDQFRAATWLALQEQPKVLSECSVDSTKQAIVRAATYGLMPARDCHFLPFKKRTTFVPNYQGLQRALDRTGKVRKSFAQAVYMQDHFVVDILADVYEHRPNVDNPGTLRCFYGCVIMKDGTKHVQVMTIAQVDAIKARSPSHESGPWVTDYVAMGRKTALKQTMKYVNLTPQITALLTEEAEREASDVPTARVQQHIADMFGDESNPTAYNPQAGEVVDEVDEAWQVDATEQADLGLNDPQVPDKVREKV